MKSDILHYGLITVIHSFGQDLKWNSHVHAIFLNILLLLSIYNFLKKIKNPKKLI
ncbi:transposase [Fusobacterium necrophorum]|uniref:transposase n=1 Tax=Fusobacterium necrophorum TaxID=859 RepID=UPI0028F742C2|nr:transposase [Fusobacterium necrophorum]